MMHDRGKCGLWDGRNSVGKIAGIELCAYHLKLCDEIATSTTVRRRVPREPRPIPRHTVLHLVCRCGRAFTYVHRQGAAAKWCESCRSLSNDAKLRRVGHA